MVKSLWHSWNPHKHELPRFRMVQRAVNLIASWKMHENLIRSAKCIVLIRKCIEGDKNGEITTGLGLKLFVLSLWINKKSPEHMLPFEAYFVFERFQWWNVHENSSWDSIQNSSTINDLFFSHTWEENLHFCVFPIPINQNPNPKLLLQLSKFNIKNMNSSCWLTIKLFNRQILIDKISSTEK